MSEDRSKKIIEGLDAEYYKLVEIVSDFDKNLLTVKGWGVTLGLAALAWGFQEQHYGLFLVASLSGVAFWVIEGAIKRHQMRHYVRMREIEVVSFDLTNVTMPDGTPVSTPQIGWSWEKAKDYFAGVITGALPRPVRYSKNLGYTVVWFLPHVFLPHALTATVGGTLFIFGLSGGLSMPL